VRLSPDEASINQLHFLQGSAGGGGAHDWEGASSVTRSGCQIQV
jgi:hypothetical protein